MKKFSIIAVCILATVLACPGCTQIPAEIGTEISPEKEISSGTQNQITEAAVWERTVLMEGEPIASLKRDDEECWWAEIPQTLTKLDSDIRITTTLSYDNKNIGVPGASSLVLNSFEDLDGYSKTMFIGFQQGMWKAYYLDNNKKTGEDFEKLTETTQTFQITITDHGEKLTITNGSGLNETMTFTPPLFSAAKGFRAYIQYCKDKIEIPFLSIERKIDSNPIIETVDPDQNIFYVDPSGSDLNSGTKISPFATVEHAKEVIRTINKSMTRDIEVILADGTYSITKPIIFTKEDSGSNGYQIIYRAAEGAQAILSGGIEINNWEKVPDSDLWKTTLDEKIKPFRQLYVNGIRATRAVLEKPITGSGYAKGEVNDQDGIHIGEPTSMLKNISRPQDLELHWIFDWKDMRLPVRDIETISENQSIVWMKQPFFMQAQWMGTWGNGTHDYYPRFDAPFFVENAFELIDQPGEWYFNEDSRELFYLPGLNEDLGSAAATIPQTDELMTIAGQGIGNEVHDIQFKGLTFAYGNWTRANDVGVVSGQAQGLICAVEGGDEMTLSHIQFKSAKSITVESCQFLHLGAAALWLGNNTRDITIKGNLFYDISDAALVIGNFNDNYLLFPALQQQPKNININNNLINSIGAEYRGAAGINAYFVENIRISHNELSDLPYTGVSLGWGWGNFIDSVTCNNNMVESNLITNGLLIARDGGGIYTLGQQPGTQIINNIIRRQKNISGCLYLDEGSAYIAVENNICDTAPNWLQVNTGVDSNNLHDNKINNNYTNVNRIETNNANNKRLNNVISGTKKISGQNWPPEAEAIIEQAGLEAPYAYLHDWLDAVNAPLR